jgi:hypothetical protein
MARRRGRSMAMAAVGLAAAGAPFVLGQQVAGAAESVASDSGSLQFVTFSGATVECGAALTAIHDTDFPDQPELSWFTGLSGDGSCFEDFSTASTATYKDEGGTTRRSHFFAAGTASGNIQGAYDDTSVTTVFNFDNCDPEQSGGQCSITLTASPK